MKKSNFYRRLGFGGLFTDFKHHARSWRNSKCMRSRRVRQALKRMEALEIYG